MFSHACVVLFSTALLIQHRRTNVLALSDLQIVQTNDERLTAEYGIKHLPKLVYFRGGDPILYTGKLWNNYRFI